MEIYTKALLYDRKHKKRCKVRWCLSWDWWNVYLIFSFNVWWCSRFWSWRLCCDV